MQKPCVRSLVALSLLSSALACASPHTHAPVNVPLVASTWQASGNATFITREAFPNGILQVTSESERGFVVSKDIQFKDGTIEFDIKPVGEEFPGIRFHQRDDGNADMLYIRVSPDCPASQDCLQYAPIVNGRILWDVYPQYQAPAPFRENEWNHIKLVVSGKRMSVYVNGRTEPSLCVAHLEGGSPMGTIAFEGTAYYANVVLEPGVTDGVDDKPFSDPAANDHRYLVHWQETNPVELGTTEEPHLTNVPRSASSWSPVTADFGGLINLARNHAPIPKGQPRQFIWLRTTMQSDRDQVPHMSVGWLREIWVYANGIPVFSGKNLYNVKGGRKRPDGRLSLENGSFDLPLHKGANEIMVALDDNTPDMRGSYGWGFMMRMDQAAGITQK
ncbi:family 16 glycoside hydrolase [Dyella sp.]|uniref:family 16 glycoside hydrolase n=1 Tax=Dyella sp. TaxID=1869338 RepID=UPI002B49AC78|nr:family 16 glycoside hydrolase [Dyella sp.]HKT29362.1 family 16 glycoside hydrolase [Dyella sp.]